MSNRGIVSQALSFVGGLLLVAAVVWGLQPSETAVLLAKDLRAHPSDWKQVGSFVIRQRGSVSYHPCSWQPWAFVIVSGKAEEKMRIYSLGPSSKYYVNRALADVWLLVRDNTTARRLEDVLPQTKEPGND